MADQVPEEVKSARRARLQALLDEQQRAFNRASVGNVVPVLFDRRGRHGHQLAGRSPHMQAVHLDCPDAVRAERLFGTVADVELTAAHANSLAGRIRGCAARAAHRSAQEPAGA